MGEEFVVGVISSVAATMLLILAATTKRRWLPSVARLGNRIRLAHQMDRSGILYVFPSRSDFQRFRGTPTQESYFRLAQKKIEVVGHSFGYGQLAQGVATELARLLRDSPFLEITLAVLDPRSSQVEAFEDYMNGAASAADSPAPGQHAGSARRFRSEIQSTLIAFQAAKDKMPASLRGRLSIRVYDTVPVASVIMLDRGGQGGRTQVNIKLYGSPYHRSFTFEVGNGSEFYVAVTESWGRILDAAEEFDPHRHLVRSNE